MSNIDFKSENRAGRLSTRLKLFCKALFSLPKTIYFNLRCFPLSIAIKLPVLISYDIKLIELHQGIITFNCSPYRFMVKIGFGGSEGVVERKGIICIENGSICFEGKADFAAGAIIRSSGNISFGKKFWTNKNCTIWCCNRISFGENVLCGWNVTFRDSDGHMIIECGEPRPVKGDIHISDHCWICSEAHILKNSSIGPNCVLGYRSLLTKEYFDNNTLFVGIPAKPKKHNIDWLRGE